MHSAEGPSGGAPSVAHIEPIRVEPLKKRRFRTGLHRFVAGLIVTVAALPIVAAGATLVVYMGGPPNRPAGPGDGAGGAPAAGPSSTRAPGTSALAVGAIAGLAGWAVLAAVAASVSSAERANAAVHRELLSQLEALEIESRSGSEPWSAVTAGPGLVSHSIYEARHDRVDEPRPSDEVWRHLEDLSRDLRPRRGFTS